LGELVVDFLGSLVPGIAFLLSIVPAFVIPTIVVVDWLIPSPWQLPVIDGNVPTSVGSILLLLFPALSAFLVFAYIVGHLFYRQDPKVADHASVMRLPRHKHHDGMVRPIKGGDIPVEFPYHFLKPYLLDRGIHYLAARVPWDGTSNFQRRAKHFANALKIRVYLECPEHFGILARNEGHVRLSSTMWYVCRAVLLASVVGAISIAAAIGAHAAGWVLNTVTAPLLLLPVSTLLASWRGKVAIEKALHYQREREVLFILETAHWLCISGRVPKMFDGLEPEPVSMVASGLPPTSGFVSAASYEMT
jgi:hypothetical protein